MDGTIRIFMGYRFKNKISRILSESSNLQPELISCELGWRHLWMSSRRRWWIRSCEWTETKHGFWIISGSFIYRHHVIETHWCCPIYANKFRLFTRAQKRRLLECRWWMTTIWILDWIREIHSSAETSTRRTYVGRRKTDTNSNFVQAWWYFAGGMVEHVQQISTQGSNGIQKSPSCTLHAEWPKIIRFLRMIKNLTPLSRMQVSSWKRIRTPPCHAKHRETQKRRHWKNQCRLAKGHLVQKHSWRKLHAPVKISQVTFTLTTLVLMNLDDVPSTKAANKGTKGIMQTVDTIHWVSTICFICRHLF